MLCLREAIDSFSAIDGSNNKCNVDLILVNIIVIFIAYFCSIVSYLEYEFNVSLLQDKHYKPHPLTVCKQEDKMSQVL